MASVLLALGGLTMLACASGEPADDTADAAPVELDAADDEVKPAVYSRVSQEVVDLVRGGGEVPVIVSLNVAPPRSGDLEAAKVTIAAAQQRLQNDLDGEGWRTRIAFENVPALAGTIDTESALAVLDRHPDVGSVDLDSGGNGDGGS